MLGISLSFHSHQLHVLHMKELRKKTEKHGKRLQEAKKGDQVKRTTEHLRYFSFLMKSGKRFLTGNLLFFLKG